jgi:hypothetical protein
MNNSLSVLNFQADVSRLWHNQAHVHMNFPVMCPIDRVIPFQCPIPNKITHPVRRSGFPSSFFEFGELDVEGNVNQVGTGFLWTKLMPITLYVDEDIEYTMTRHSTGLLVAWYDSNRNFIESTSVAGSTLTITNSTPQARYVRLAVTVTESAFASSDFRFYPNSITDSPTISIIADGETDVVVPVTEYRVEAWGGYDLIIYDPTVALVGLNVNKLAQVKISDSAYSNDYTSEYIQFGICSGLIKITYYHDEPILHGGGQINYASDYKSEVYLKGKIGKPSYPTENKVETRGGNPYITRFVSRLEYSLFSNLPEFICNALRVIGGHKYLFIEYQGQEYNVDKAEFNAEYEEKGDLADVNIVFSTNTTAITHSSPLPDFINLEDGDFNNDYNEDYYH